ncbi:hypothetical protein [Herpetosiphon sp. NSE202]|uniref:hypothetical protein n=1 Tax=Herpetosiphon sp. NSE202 TaxID=3351349 RepID=UPI003633FFCE
MQSIDKLFVNREKQTAGFIKMLQGQTPKRIMMIEASGGLGKSWTVEFMRAECQRQGIPNAEIDFADSIVFDFLALLRRARDGFGVAAFNLFTQAINEVTQPTVRIETGVANTNAINNLLGQSNTFSGSNVNVGEVVAGNVIKDNSFVINADNAVVRQALQDRLSGAFFECLAALTSQGPLCFFFDTYDKVTVEAEAWLMGQLLPQIRDGLIKNVVVVIAGRSVPKLDSQWDHLIARTGLDLLSEPHVKEYLVQRRGLSDDPNVIKALFQGSTGQPQLLAMLADNILRSQASGGDDDWL